MRRLRVGLRNGSEFLRPMRALRNGLRILFVSGFAFAAPDRVWAHMDPYVLFVCRFADSAGRPVSGLTLSLDLGPTGGEAPIESGAAKVQVGFKWNYRGTVHLRVYDAKRRPIAWADGSLRDSAFAYAHQVGSGMRPNQGAAGSGVFGDFLKDGTVYPGGDGKLYDRAGAAPVFTLAWTPPLAGADSAEDRRARVVDRGIETDLRARLAEIRSGRRRP